MQTLELKNKAVFLLLALYFAMLPGAPGQPQGNPFELNPRMARPAQGDTIGTAATGNPFDLVAPSSDSKAKPSAIAAPNRARKKNAPPSEASLSAYKRFLLITNLSSLLLLTMLLILFRAHVSRTYRAFLNDNMLSQLQREREAGGGLPYYLYYAFFMANAGLFLFLLSRHYGLAIHSSHWVSLLYCIICVAGLFLGKHLILGILAFIFPLQKEARLYSFTIIVFSIMLGFFLLGANLILSYASDSLVTWMIPACFGLIGLLYLFRSLRGLFIANRFLLFHKFHFLLYICTIEIAPVIVLAKLIIS